MSALNEEDRTTPHDPLYYAPRRLRERARSRQSTFGEAQSVSETGFAEGRTSIDLALENAVYQSLRRPLEPEIMEPPPVPGSARDRRKVLFGAAAIVVSAAVALFFALMVHASPESNAAASFAAAVRSMKIAPPQQGASQAATAEQSEKLLQQFMQWRQKTNSAEMSR